MQTFCVCVWLGGDNRERVWESSSLLTSSKNFSTASKALPSKGYQTCSNRPQDTAAVSLVTTAGTTVYLLSKQPTGRLYVNFWYYVALTDLQPPDSWYLHSRLLETLGNLTFRGDACKVSQLTSPFHLPWLAFPLPSQTS